MEWSLYIYFFLLLLSPWSPGQHKDIHWSQQPTSSCFLSLERFISSELLSLDKLGGRVNPLLHTALDSHFGKPREEALRYTSELSWVVFTF